MEAFKKDSGFSYVLVDYNLVKYCRMCKKRFVVNKSESKKNYCDDCQSRFNNEHEEQK